MREKIYEFAIDHALTATRRKKIERYIAENTHLAPSKVDSQWNEESPNVLELSTPPVQWEVHFQPKKVEVYGTAPFWARALFTKSKRAELKTQLEELLQKAGFIASPKETA